MTKVADQISDLATAVEALTANVDRLVQRELPVRPDDRLGRQEPLRRFGERTGTLGFLTQTAPSIFIENFTSEVPAEMQQDDTMDDGRPCVVVPCTCGHGDIVVALGTVERCEGDGCGRWFANFGKAVKVARAVD